MSATPEARTAMTIGRFIGVFPSFSGLVFVELGFMPLQLAHESAVCCLVGWGAPFADPEEGSDRDPDDSENRHSANCS